VLSEITGLSGQRILDAILAGERDPIKLAELCHARVKSSQDTVARALEGDYRAQHLFTLKQSLADYRYYQRQIEEVEQEVHRRMVDLPVAGTAQPELPQRTKKHPYATKHNDPPHSACGRSYIARLVLI
jgi:transposase